MKNQRNAKRAFLQILAQVCLLGLIASGAHASAQGGLTTDFRASIAGTIAVTSPAVNSTVQSPVAFAAVATSSNCRAGTASVGIYVSNQLKYVVSGSQLNTTLAIPAGAQHTVVQAWDKCGSSFNTVVDFTVPAASGNEQVSLTAKPSKINVGGSAILTATAVQASKVNITGSDGSSYTVSASGGSVTVHPAKTTSYTAKATGSAGTVNATAIITVAPVTSPPAIKHVFVIMLENESFAQTFGSSSPAPYLAHTLTAEGQLLTNYFGIGHHSAPNYMALISGQAPGPDTQGDCQKFADFNSSTFAADGQLVGQGCVFAAPVETLPNQLEGAGRTWHGYIESMPGPCTHPALNALDPWFSASPTNEYATRHNPFVFFHSIIDHPTCAANDVPLTQFASDLASLSSTRNLSFIVPNLCHDGHDAPCADGEAGGLASADAFLRQWVPTILNSPAFKQDGVLIITFDEAEYGTGGGSDSTACCNEIPGPNAQSPGLNGPGGGRIGAVVLSPFVQPGTQNGNPYNHYSLLKTMESIFGVPGLGFAQPANVPTFGTDVFGRKP